jgi:single-stranded-DNA-specific exonuclease
MVNNKKQKLWQMAEKPPTEFAEKFPEIHSIVRQLLFNRGLDTQEKIDEFLYPDYSQDIFDPFLFAEMDKAVKRIWQAIEKNQKILVYGDYDADGVCSATVLTSFFKQVNMPVGVYIPHRELEGYGLNESVVNEFIKAKYDLVITIDCGTSNIKEVELLQDADIDVIVVDHHHVAETHVQPYAFLNCANAADSYPFKELAAVGMAFKLVQGLIIYARQQSLPFEFPVGWEKWLLDLVAIATVTDIMPLVSENHTLVKYGLVVLNKTRRIGLQKLITLAGLAPGSIDTWQIGFIIGPRLNAAGRIDHANDAYALLNETDTIQAEKFASKLQAANTKRQQLTEQFVKEAKEQAAEQFAKGDNILVVYKEGWDLGLVGLVAGRLTEFYRRPTLAITLNQGKIMGSGRSLAGYSIIDAVAAQSEFLNRFGGHDGACGFTVKNKKALTQFTKAIKLAVRELDIDLFLARLNIDAEITLAEVDWQLIEDLKKFEPFGEANPSPKFLTRGLQVIGVEFVGEENKHLRLMVADEHGLVRKTIGFGLGREWGNVQMGDRLDIVYEAGVNEWNGNRELQLKIIDLKSHE